MQSASLQDLGSAAQFTLGKQEPIPSPDPLPRKQHLLNASKHYQTIGADHQLDLKQIGLRDEISYGLSPESSQQARVTSSVKFQNFLQAEEDSPDPSRAFKGSKRLKQISKSFHGMDQQITSPRQPNKQTSLVDTNEPFQSLILQQMHLMQQTQAKMFKKVFDQQAHIQKDVA